MKHSRRYLCRKNFFALTISFLILSTFYSCQKTDTPKPKEKSAFTLQEALKLSEENLGALNTEKLLESCSGVHFEYDGAHGPENWGSLCGEWAACSQGQAQSPVDILNAVHDNSLAPLKFSWGSTTTNIVNNGHTIQFNVDPGSYMTSNGKTYELLQFHYHHTSEHSIDGNYFPLEVHYVHRAADGQLAVIGVMFKEGPSNWLFNTVQQHFPQPLSVYASPATLNLKALLPPNLKYYQYSGSLTTPACSENVNWHVLKGWVFASKAQIESFKHLIHENNRPVQPLNGRVVKFSTKQGNGQLHEKSEE